MKKIITFWNWFQDNQQTIYNLQTETSKNRKYISFWITKHLNYYSPGIEFVISFPKKPNKSATLTITANGNPEYFNAVTNLIDQAPKIKNWTFEAFIQPKENLELFSEERDHPFIFQDLTIKASQARFLPLDCNETCDKFNIIVYLKNYNIHCNTHNWKEALYIIMQSIFGEKFTLKHLSFVQLAQYPDDDSEAIELYLLENYIDHFRSEFGKE
jgi:hypothetical protein